MGRGGGGGSPGLQVGSHLRRSASVDVLLREDDASLHRAAFERLPDDYYTLVPPDAFIGRASCLQLVQEANALRRSASTDVVARVEALDRPPEAPGAFAPPTQPSLPVEPPRNITVLSPALAAYQRPSALPAVPCASADVSPASHWNEMPEAGRQSLKPKGRSLPGPPTQLDLSVDTTVYGTPAGNGTTRTSASSRCST